MRPRAIYRWKCFWLGVAVLVFLMWMWVRSVMYRDAVTFYFPGAGHELTLASRAGAFTVAWEELPAWGGVWPVFTTSHQPVAGGRWFPPAVEMWDGTWGEVSYWLVVLVFLGVWGFCLAWKWKRERRIAA